MELPIVINFIDEKLKTDFYKLKKGGHFEQKLYNHLQEALENIKTNVFCGIQVPKRLIPKEYVKNYRIKNLWKFNLPSGWRLLYSIVGEEVFIIALILEWLNHKEYERRFKY